MAEYNDSNYDSSISIDQSTAQITLDFTIPEKFEVFETLSARIEGIKKKSSEMMDRLASLERTISLIYNDRGMQQVLMANQESESSVIKSEKNELPTSDVLENGAHKNIIKQE